MSDNNDASEGTYDLLFRGELLPDADLTTAQTTLAALLKLDDVRLQQLFSGANVMIRRAADRATAARFQSLFRQAGARLRVMPVAPTASPTTVDHAAPQPPTGKLSLAARLAAQEAAAAPVSSGATHPTGVAYTPTRASAAGATDAAVARSSLGSASASATALGPIPPAQVRDVPPALRRTAKVRTPNYELAPVGADLIDEDERETAPSAFVQTDHLGLAEAGGLIPNLSVLTRQMAMVQVPDLDLAPVGVLLGELTEFVELPLDLSAYSLAPVGARLGHAQTAATLVLDLSHLTLEPVPRV